MVKNTTRVGLTLILSFLITTFIITLLIAGRFPKTDRILALLITVTLIYMSATFEQGADYGNYIDKIHWVRSSKANNLDLLAQLTVASDPLFWGITVLTEMISEDPLWVFYILLSIALLTKFWFTARFPAYRSLILSSYALFLAPTLEFAAIRASTALGIFLLALCFEGGIRRFIVYTMSVGAHVSAAVPVLVLTLSSKIRKISSVLIAGTCIVLIPLLSGAVNKLGRAQEYIDNQGSLFALAPPAATLLLLFISFSSKWMRQRVMSQEMVGKNYQIALVCTSIALGGSPLWVTVAHRFLEIGQFFFCVTACTALKGGYSRIRIVIGLIGIFALLVYKNVALGTWNLMM
jgi:hypothetical protein